MARKLIVEIVGDSRSYERALGRSAKATKTFQGTISGATGSVFKGIAAFTGVAVGVRGLSNVLTGGVRDFGNFQQSLQRTVGLSGVAQSAIKGLSKQVLQLAPVVGKSPQELADALYFVTSSGISAAHAMDVVAVSAKASAAGLGDTATVADAVTSAMNAYGQANLSASQASDVLVATVREGKGEATDFAGVIGNVAALAAQLGVSFDQVGAALAAQTRLGTDAETSATQLQRVFSTLVKVTPQSAKAFHSVGLDADKLRAVLAQPGGLLIALEQIRKAFGNNVPAMAKAFGDIRALRGVLSLVGKQGATTAGIFNRLAQSQGATASAFGAISNTQTQQFAKLQASLKVLSITLGSALTPAILDIVRPLNRWFSNTKNQQEAQRKLKETVRQSVGAIKDFINAVKPIAAFAKDASDKLGGLKNTLQLIVTTVVASKVLRIAGALTGIGTEAAGATAEVNLLRLALLRLGPLAAIVIGVEVVLHHKQIEDTVDKFLRGHHLGFLTGKKIDIPVTTDVRKLEAIKKHLDDIGQSGSLMAAAIQGAIDKLNELNAVKIVEPGEGNLGGPGGTFVPTKTPKVTTPTSTFDVSASGAETPEERKKRLAAEKKARAAAVTAHKAALTKAKNAFDELLAALNVRLDKAKTTKSFKDDLRVLQAIRAAILARIKVVGKTAELAGDLFQNTQDLKEATQSARKAAQFVALGLTPEGDKPTPSSGALLRRAVGIQTLIKGTVFDTKKTRSELTKIVNFLKTHLKTAGREVRQAILEMLNSLNVPAKGKGPLTKTAGLNTKKILEGLGLSPEEERALRARLSHFNTAGRKLAASGSRSTSGSYVDDRPVEVHTTVTLDGKKVANSTTRHQQRDHRRNPRQKRGPNRMHGI